MKIWSKFLWLILLLPSLATAQPSQSKEALAMQYFEEGDYARAEVLLDELYDRNPSKSYYEPLLQTKLQLKNFDGAETLVKKHMKMAGRNDYVYIPDLIYVIRQKGDTKKEEKILQQLLDQVARTPAYAYQITQLLNKYGLYETSLEVLNKAERSQPSLNLNYQKASVYAEMGRLEDMFSEYLELIDRNPAYLSTVKTTFGMSVTDNPSNETNDMLRGMLIKKVNQSDNIIYTDLLIWLLQREQNYGAVFVQLRALEKRGMNVDNRLMDLAKNAAENLEYDVAYRALDKIISKGKQNFYHDEAIVALYTIKQSQLENDETKRHEDWKNLLTEAHKHKNTLSQHDELYDLDLLMSSWLYKHLEDEKQAEDILENLLSRPTVSATRLAKAKMMLAELKLWQADFWDALLLYTQVEKEFKGIPLGQEARYRKAKVAFFQGDVQYAMGQFDALKTSTSKFIANDAMEMWLLISTHTALDTNMEAMKAFSRASFEYWRGNSPLALQILESLTAQYPQHTLQSEILYLKGLIAERNQDYDTAIDLFSQTANKHRKSLKADDALLHLARIYAKQNNTAAALDTYQKLLTEHGDSYLTHTARKEFRKLRGDLNP